MLTEKDFEAIATIIRDSFGNDLQTEYAPFHFVQELSDYYDGMNRNFDRESFINNCMGDDNV